MSNLPQINRKIKSVRVTSRITRALEIVSATQSHIYRDLQSKSLVYFQGIYKIFYEVFSDPEHDIRETNKRLISFSRKKRELWLLLGTDIGMCGDMNDQMKKYILHAFNPKGDGLVVLGNRLASSIEKDLGQYFEFKDKSELGVRNANSSIRKLTKRLFNLFMDKGYQKLTIVYMKDPKKGILEKLNLLPFTEKYFSNRKKVFVSSFNAQVKYPDVVIDLFPQYLECIILGAVISSKLGEHLIRRELMNSATKNANELLDEYTLLFNKIRQSNITQEITEIVVASQFKTKK
ncbi:F0F1 ATP synthase subunit gamma [Candidatus Mycoplasma haematohominis]|uniref:ATP synthase gamma chain n=1 Tax=Candidatus Mycoplasma haematohominis TaxID=1494318 RepID=A0A478FQP7_9MOLU|nr:F0F1 ATP synthase subunit gamma [Candidatus Mycoplasma haemohominis]GCE63831.1 ATP synthase gamma chain [Candidatus Mycoplasma haemohominis]